MSKDDIRPISTTSRCFWAVVYSASLVGSIAVATDPVPWGTAIAVGFAGVLAGWLLGSFVFYQLCFWIGLEL
jgi:hypothetical protein